MGPAVGFAVELTSANYLLHPVAQVSFFGATVDVESLELMLVFEKMTGWAVKNGSFFRQWKKTLQKLQLKPFQCQMIVRWLSDECMCKMYSDEAAVANPPTRRTLTKFIPSENPEEDVRLQILLDIAKARLKSGQDMLVKGFCAKVFQNIHHFDE